MKQEEISVLAANATRWSTITEVIAKLISPVTSMILARLLTPEAFGVVATINMVISFADMFTDAGFQKFLVQHEFKSKRELDQNTTVAFWTNLTISLVAWTIIAIFSEKIAILVGNPGLGKVISIAAISLPLTSFSSIQMAYYKRNFDFRTLFFVRVIGICVPLVVTVPLAFITRSYWALVIGTIVGNLVNALVLTMRSEWKPSLYFSFSKLKEMFFFSWWILLESVSIWLTSNIGIFIVGTYLSSYYLGLYKTSMTTTNQIMGLVTSATSAPLFTALSKLQNNEKEFKNVYFSYIQAVAVFIVPLGIGMFLYRNFLTMFLLGNQWMEAANFIGLWSLISSVSLVLGTYCSGIYNAKGKPIFSFAVQIIYLIILIPILFVGARSGFVVLYVGRSLSKLLFVAVQLVIMKLFFGFSPLKLIKQIIPAVICSGIMILVSLALKLVSSFMLWQVVCIFICIIVYFASMKLMFSKVLKDAFETLGFKLGKRR